MADRDEDMSAQQPSPEERPLTRREALAREQGKPVPEPGPEAKVADADTAPRGPGPNPEPEDAGSRRDVVGRLASALKFRANRSQLLAGVLCALLGFAFVAQLQQTEDAGFSQLSEPELIRILGDVDSRNQRLEQESASLRRDEDELRSSTNQQEAAQKQAEERARSMQIITGTVPVTGPGVDVTITAQPGQLSASNLVTLVQELRDAGAEAIEIGGHRVVVSTYFTDTPTGGLEIDGEPVDLPIRIQAIGQPDTMDTALRIPGGIYDTVEKRGGAMTINQETSLDIDSIVPQLGSG
ncbi:DUF881 domain-containing protein [Brevibacterium luteolum]|uniref:DUF881 domain-containing protein n=1 Tax=Brevibacterium luteolum TaxID=199591 RepID=UPI00223C2913|nr:DUF881 domain-containing protein [Brevibacterium luteolum]MCT1657646.1 DUF881 domain-containing protein [Brevibacterium luteolum]MCT1920632.1 DUF881 domain-containing protein [Brevibacterium luteolum]